MTGSPDGAARAVRHGRPRPPAWHIVGQPLPRHSQRWPACPGGRSRARGSAVWLAPRREWRVPPGRDPLLRPRSPGASCTSPARGRDAWTRSDSDDAAPAKVLMAWSAIAGASQPAGNRGRLSRRSAGGGVVRWGRRSRSARRSCASRSRGRRRAIGNAGLWLPPPGRRRPRPRRAAPGSRRARGAGRSGRLAEQHVAQHAAADAGDRAEHDRLHRAEAEVERLAWRR